MRDSPPRRPDGSDKEATFARSQWNKDHGTEAKFLNSNTIKVKQGSRGISWHAVPKASSGSQPAVSLYAGLWLADNGAFITVNVPAKLPFNSYQVNNQWFVYVAKPYWLQQVPAAPYNLNGQVTEIWPPYLNNELVVFCAPTNGINQGPFVISPGHDQEFGPLYDPFNAEIMYVDLNITGHQWSVRTPFCNGVGSSSNRWVVSSGDGQ